MFLNFIINKHVIINLVVGSKWWDWYLKFNVILVGKIYCTNFQMRSFYGETIFTEIAQYTLKVINRKIH